MRALLPMALLVAACGGERVNPAPCEDPARDPLLRGPAWDGPLFAEVLDIAVQPERVFACTGIHAMVTVDRDSWVATTAPRPSISLADGIGSVCQHVAVRGDRALITHRGDEFSPTPHLTLYEVGGEPVELSAIADGGSWEGAEVLGGGWYAAGLHEQGVVLLQEVAGELVERARLADGLDNVWDLFLAAEGELWVADGSGVARLDVTDPTAPRLVARAPLAGSVKDLRVAGERVAASAGAEGVHLLDRTTLAPLGLVPTPGSAVGATFSDDALVVADWSEARVYDVSDPQTPRLVTTERIDPRFTPAPFARVLTVGADGAEVFLGEWSAGIFRAELRADRPAPDLRWEGRTLEFPKAALGEEVALALVFENEGAEPLAISRLEASPPFRALASELTVPTDGAEFVELRYTTETLDVVNGTLELLTDDPDECTVSIPLVANEDDLGVGDVFPDFTIDDLQSGEPLTLSSLEGEVVLLSYFATF